jgi:2-dehydro-3-deoxy-L-rhamnonate dehydrogenase (NAD+)
MVTDDRTIQIMGNNRISVQSSYSASRGAVISMTKSLGKELATTSVLGNVIAPSVIATGVAVIVPAEIWERSKSLIPMGYLRFPEECAELVAVLTSKRVSSSTAAVYDITGGRATY